MDLELAYVRYNDEVVRELTDEVQAEYGRLYGGGGDVSPMDPDQFEPPAGRFLLATLAGAPVGMGGWRWGGPRPGDAEIKRMYVRSSQRRTGVARRILLKLEESAAEAGVLRMVLETGIKQPQAIAMYRASGYLDIPRFGHYADAPDAVHLGRDLTG